MIELKVKQIRRMGNLLMKYCKPDLMLNVAWMVLILFSNNVFANENTEDLLSKEADKTYQLEKIVVSATRQPLPRQDVAANITVVDRQIIEKMSAATVAEVLQYIPGWFRRAHS